MQSFIKVVVKGGMLLSYEGIKRFFDIITHSFEKRLSAYYGKPFYSDKKILFSVTDSVENSDKFICIFFYVYMIVADGFM